ncbi:hypothetical protein SK128_024502 [Halocaridina rubra]|uniref:Uncharacterized protein n=1 Tax=Halocaridina rubra TaxID=373956 RepID=A0AAN8WR91_HALRR
MAEMQGRDSNLGATRGSKQRKLIMGKMGYWYQYLRIHPIPRGKGGLLKEEIKTKLACEAEVIQYLPWLEFTQFQDRKENLE